MFKFVSRVVNKFEFKLAFYILGILLVWKIVFIPFKRFKAYETIAPFKEFSLEKDIEKFKGFNFVEVGLNLRSFGFHDVRKHEFEIKGLVWFKFDPKLVSESDIDQFIFDKTVKEIRGKPFIEVAKDGKKVALYYVDLIFKNNLIFKNFPYNDHRVFINVLNEQLISKNVLLCSKDKNFGIGDKVSQLSDFMLLEKGARSAYYELQADSVLLKNNLIYPEASFFVDLKVNSLGGFFIILFPLLVIMFLALISLLIESLAQTLAVTLQALFTLLVYRYVLSYVAPEISEYVFSDICFVMILFFICFTILTNIVCFHYIDIDSLDLKIKEKFIFIRSLIFIILQTSFVSLFYLFIPR